MLVQLWLPIVLSAVALFFLSFLSWMVLGLHKGDYRPIPREDDFMRDLEGYGLERGKTYLFPNCPDAAAMKSGEFRKKLAAGPNGYITVFHTGSGMGPKLALTLLYFLLSSLIVAYLGTIVLAAGEPTLKVFRFFTTAGLLTHLSAMLPQAIWFKNRITAHVIEAVAYAFVLGGLFAVMWPKA